MNRRYLLIAGVILSLAPATFAAEDAPTTTGNPSPVATEKPVVKNDPKLDRALFKALEDNKESEALAALSQGANPNAKGKDGITPLMLTVQNGKVSLTQKLLESGADANAINKNQQAPLHLVMSIGAPKPKKKRFGGLGGMLGGAVLGAASGAALSGGLGSFGSNAMWAGNLLGSAGLDGLLGANLTSFLQGGVFNLSGASGWNAVIGTALRGDLGANGIYGLQSILGSTGHLDAGGWINLASAVQSADPTVLGVMSQVPGGDPRWSQFMSAAAAGNRSAVDNYLADPAMRPLLDQAAQGLNDARNELPGNAAKTIVTALLTSGAKADVRDKSGKTPAELATDRGWTDVVALLNAKPSAPAAAPATTPEAPAAVAEAPTTIEPASPTTETAEEKKAEMANE